MLKLSYFTVLEDGHRLEARLELDGQPFQLFFASPQVALAPQSEACLAAVLPTALMVHASQVQAEGTASQEFLDILAKAQALLLKWRRGWRGVEIQGVTPTHAAPPGGPGIGVFFSLGVDSFYFLLSHLVFIHGCDVSLPEQDLRRRISAAF